MAKKARDSTHVLTRSASPFAPPCRIEESTTSRSTQEEKPTIT